VAQLGARFHGMEEVVGSNPTRSTKVLISTLRLDLNRRPVRYCPPDLVHFLVGNCDAAIGPILQAVTASYPAIAIGKPMHVDIAAR
jgi:hypothetical protein